MFSSFQLLPTMQDMVKNSIRYNRLYTADVTVLICGVPNVGKSSLMNILRAQGAHKSKCKITAIGKNLLLIKNRVRASGIFVSEASAPVGAVAGITRAVQNRVKVCNNPNIYVLDSPGILEPTLRSTEAALRLAACCKCN